MREADGEAQTLAVRLTQDFYAWERLGRGWQVWPYPVRPEPPFAPFAFRAHLARGDVPDDGRTPSAFGRLYRALIGQDEAPSPEPEPKAPAPQEFADRSPVVEVGMSLPRGQGIEERVFERLLVSLQYDAPLAFEIVGTPNRIRYQLVCRESALNPLREQLRGFCPDLVLEERTGWLESVLVRGPRVVEFGLSHEFMLPLTASTVDPLTPIVAAMGALRPGEVAVLQVLFERALSPWADHAWRALGDGAGGSFFEDAPNLMKLSQEKLNQPLFGVNVRLAVQAASDERMWDVLRAMGGGLDAFGSPDRNAFIPLQADGYPMSAQHEDVIRRRSRRSGMLLSLGELASLVHPPSETIRVERLESAPGRTKAAPAIAAGNDLVLGTNTHHGQAIPVSLDVRQRLRHMHVIGASGTGKSTLLLNMVEQDIRGGHGFAVLDPHGDLIDEILGLIPDERIDDVVLLDASDDEFPIGFNVLDAKSEIEKNLLASDLVAAFRRLSTTWGDQMTSVLGNAILAVLESTQGGTLADLRRFLVEPDFRSEFLKTVTDPEVVYYWTREFPLLTGRPQAPLLTRLDTFLRPRLIRSMVNQRANRLDFRAMMDGKQIFLAKLAQGAIGEENAHLLGTLIVTKLHQMALGRQNVPESERTPFFLYIDECHHFITSSMASILSGARKFGMGLILSHQELHQVLGHNADVAAALIANPYTRVCFRLGDDDARKLQSGFAFFDAQDLQSLGVGKAIVRMEQAEQDFTLTTTPFKSPDPTIAQARRDQIVARSRARYARRRDEVEEELLRARTPETPSRDRHEPPRRYGPPPGASRAKSRPGRPASQKPSA